MIPFKPGDIVNVTIKGVRVDDQDADGSFTILDERNYCYTMPPQAAIEHAPGAGKDPAEQDDRIAKVLTLLDAMESEGDVAPYIVATIRQTIGEPPRAWPPQPGDVWSDENPFCSLWFAQINPHDGGAEIVVMAPLYGGPQGISVKAPDELLKSSSQLALAYRKAGAR